MARKTTKTAAQTIEPDLTLAELSARYIANFEEQGKSAGTCFSYLMELRLAQSELGAETLVSTLTPDAIAAFNTSKRVVKLKSGKAKSQLSIDKSRRVLRLALTWAHQTGLLAEPLVDPKHDSLPGDGASDVTVVVGDKVVNKPAPSKKGRGRKQEITLEVSQPDSVAAAGSVDPSVAADVDTTLEPTTAA